MKAYFLGIGGIGMSALAFLYHRWGWEVAGEDLQETNIVKELRKEGIKVFIPRGEIPKGTNRIVYSLAVPQKLLQRRLLKFQGEAFSYPEALGELSKKFYTISVIGSHGKSTTTALLALSLLEAGLSPTVIVGTKLREFGNKNFYWGKEPFLVLETDEYQKGFLNVKAQAVLLTNIDKEHLDTFGSWDGVQRGFFEFLGQVPETGVVVLNPKEIGISVFLKMYGKKIRAKILTVPDEASLKIKKAIRIPGEHNVRNALLVSRFLRFFLGKEAPLYRVLSCYKGAWRRFEVFNTPLFTVISDYAHHPTELRAFLEALSDKFPNLPKLIFFQPHQVYRLWSLREEWLSSLRERAEKIYILKAYRVPGREKRGVRYSSLELVKRCAKENIRYLERPEEILGVLKREVLRNNKRKMAVALVGAGDIVKVLDSVLQLGRSFLPERSGLKNLENKN